MFPKTRAKTFGILLAIYLYPGSTKNIMIVIWDDYSKWQMEYDTLSTQFEQCQADKQANIGRVNELQEENKKLSDNVRAMSIRSDIDYEGEIMRLKEKLQSKAMLIKELEGHLSGANHLTLRRESLSNEISELKQILKHKNDEIDELKENEMEIEDIEHLQQENKILRTNLDEMDIVIIENKKLKEENERLEQRITSIGDMVDILKQSQNVDGLHRHKRNKLIFRVCALCHSI